MESLEQMLPSIEAQHQRLKQQAADSREVARLRAQAGKAEVEAQRLARLLAEAEADARGLRAEQVRVLEVLARVAERLQSLAQPEAARAPPESCEDAAELCEALLEPLEQTLQQGPELDTASQPDPESRPEWEDNAANCSVCGSALGKRRLKARHHCRACGRCVCAGCSPSTVQLEDKALQRVCTPCVQAAFKRAR